MSPLRILHQSVKLTVAIEHTHTHTHARTRARTHARTHALFLFYVVLCSIYSDGSILILPFNATSAIMFVIYVFLCMFCTSHGAQKKDGSGDIGKPPYMYTCDMTYEYAFLRITSVDIFLILLSSIS